MMLLMVRETPLHLGHLRAMLSTAEIGAIIAPTVPAMYTKLQSTFRRFNTPIVCISMSIDGGGERFRGNVHVLSVMVAP